MPTIKQTMWIGVWLCLIPFLGVPGVWKERLLILTGLFLFFGALRTYYTSTMPHQQKDATPLSFPEGTPSARVEPEEAK